LLTTNIYFLLINSISRFFSKRSFLFATTVLVLISTPSKAQIEPVTKSDDYIITKHSFSVEDGLAARQVTSAIEDKDGFMWFGTTNGLSRYDGNSFKTFNKQNFGLLENEIASLLIDEKNHLIISFQNKSKSITSMKKGMIQVLVVGGMMKH
jgi:ligand-binding sensor domain-containing protein